MKHVVMLSGGLSSWVAARRVKAKMQPGDELVLLFADTLIEDADLYRFLAEVAADIAGASIRTAGDLAARALALPEASHSLMAERKAQLAQLRADTMACYPVLTWIADGRTPWEVFRDKRFLGNSRIDPCSRILKRELLKAWLESHCDPAATTVYTGIGWWEEHRQVRLVERNTVWRYEAPLCERPLVTQPGMEELAQAAGIRIPRLYPLGFKHNNCGGGCVKAGIGQFAHLHKTLPHVFDIWEREELRLRMRLGDVAMLEDRRGGGRRPLPLYKLRARLEGKDAPLDACEINDTRGCGCAIDDDEEEVA